MVYGCSYAAEIIIHADNPFAPTFEIYWKKHTAPYKVSKFEVILVQEIDFIFNKHRPTVTGEIAWKLSNEQYKTVALQEIEYCKGGLGFEVETECKLLKPDVLYFASAEGYGLIGAKSYFVIVKVRDRYRLKAIDISKVEELEKYVAVKRMPEAIKQIN